MHDPATLYQDPILANMSVGPEKEMALKKLKPGMGIYQVMNMSSKAPDKSKPWCVVNLQTGAINGRWHASREEALAQARALYAKLGAKAKVHTEEAVHNAYFLFADPAMLVAEDGAKWVEAIAPKTYVTPAYGEVVITPEQIDAYVRNINTNVRGQDIAINFEHGIDPSKGLKAAGWIKQARKNDRGILELAVDFTEKAKEEIRSGEWKYFSLEWDDEWLHPDGMFYQDVVMGGALTNRPVAKNLMPINFSEIFAEQDIPYAEIVDPPVEEETPAEDEVHEAPMAELIGEHLFAVWDTKYVNSLPDSSFAWIESGGTKTDGKTDSAHRHLPYKDSSGKIDLAHVRNMLARVSQVKGIPPAVVSRVKALGGKLLGAKQASEITEALDEYYLGEQKELEHSQPGTGDPRLIDAEFVDDPAIESGSRRNTPPFDDPPQVGKLYNPVENGEVMVQYSEAEAVGYVSAAVPGLKRIHTNDGDKLVERTERILATPSASRSFSELQNLANEVRGYLRSNKEHDIGDVEETTVETVEMSESDTTTTTGGYTVGELTERDLRELRAVLDVDDDAKIVEGVKVKFGELAALRDSVSANEQERIFAEQYPQFYEQHQRLVEEQRKGKAKNFSESVEKIRKAEGFGLKTTTQGLSTTAKEKIEEVHLKFSENKATVDDFEEAIKAITNGGIVNFGELGTSKEDEVIDVDTSGPQGIQQARHQFAELVSRVQKDNPEFDYQTAVNEAAKKNPDLAEAYKITLPA